MIEELKCTNCGAPLNPKSLKCEYCGSQYERKQENGLVKYIQTCPAQTRTIGAQVVVPSEFMRMTGSVDRFPRYVHDELSKMLACEILKYAEFQTHYDPMHNVKIVRGFVRVVEPDFRF